MRSATEVVGSPESVLAPLPTAASSIVGRENELLDLLVQVASSRVVTLIGTGGVGKTRLAIEATHVLAAVGRRLGFVELADVIAASDVMSAIADQLSVTVVVGALQFDGLVRCLAGDTVVLILDNFEHLLDATPELQRLFDECPALDLVVTSRHALGLRDECTFAVRPLEASRGATPIPSPAAQLFLERALITEPTEPDIDHATRIVTALGGLPLAIELAAFRARALGADTVDELLTSQLALDGFESPAHRDHRHGSLRRCIDWTVRDLDDHARYVLQATGAFAGTFDLVALRAVAGERASTAAALATLVEHHLVERVGRSDGVSRFTCLPPIREYARERLIDSECGVEVLKAHASYYADRAASVRSLFEQDATDKAFAAYRAEARNINFAVTEYHRANELAAAARIVCDIAKLVLELGGEARLVAWFRDLAQTASRRNQRLPHEASIWAAYGELAEKGPATAALCLLALDRAIDNAHADGDDAAVLVGLDRMSYSVIFHGDVLRSIDATRQGVVLATQLARQRPLAQFLLWRAMIEHVAGDIEGACDHGLEALRIARELGDTRLVVRVGLLFAPMEAAGIVPARTANEAIPTLDACLDAARACRSTLDELYVVMQLAVRAGFNDSPDVFALVATGLSLADRTRNQRAELVFVLALASAAFNAADDRTGTRFHAAVQADWNVLSTLIPKRGLEHYLGIVERRRALDPAGFDKRVGDAAAILWTDVIAAAHEYTARGLRRRTGFSLTPRECEVLREIAAGGTNKEIARALGMRPKTVMHHCAAIYRKLGVSTRSEATAVAIRNKLAKGVG